MMAGERTIKVRFTGDAAGLKRAASAGERAVESFQAKVGRVARTVAVTAALGTAMASTAAHAIALGSAVSGAAGAIALVPAALGATIATLAAARAVTFGLGEAWKATGQQAAGGGGAAVNTARQVAAAQRQVRAATEGVADAQRQVRAATRDLAEVQREALAAQQAVTRARAEEAERLEELSRSVRGARLDEQDATDAVTAAEQELDRARKSTDPQAIARADRAYQRAALTLEDVRDRVEDLSAEQADAQRKGIAGSDAVQEALARQAEAQQRVGDAAERQADAQRGLTEATQRLAEAQDALKDAGKGAAAGGINPATAALAKLAPAARQTILTLRALVPGWQAAARAGQQATFAGVAGDLKRLSGAYLPLATSWLTRMGGAFNTAIRQAAGLATTAATVRDVGAFTTNTATATDRLARAVRPAVSGLMQFVTVGSAFLPGLAAAALSLAQRFERWAAAARQSGRMQQWISTALSVLDQLRHIATDVVASVVAIFRAGDDGGSTLDALQHGATAMRAWLESVQGQQVVADTLARMRDVLTGLAQILPAVAGHGQAFTDTMNVTGTVVGFLAGHLDTLAKLLPVIAAGYGIAKLAEVGANTAAVASLPIKAAEVAANWGMRAAIKAQTTALIENTAVTRAAAGIQTAETTATNAGILARARAVVSMTAQKIATVAGTVATWAATAATSALAAAMWLVTSPIGLVILAVAAFAAGLVLLWRNSETFRTVVTAAFNAVWTAIRFVWDWVRSNWPLMLAILTGPIGVAVLAIVKNWDRVRAGASAVVDWVRSNWPLLLAIITGPIGLAVLAVTKNWDKIRAGASAVVDWVRGRFDALVGLVTGLPGRISKASAGMWDGIKNAFRAAINWIVDKWNGLEFKLPAVDTHIPGVGKVGGFTLGTPNLPRLERGGAALAGRTYLVGERGPELLTMGATSGHVTPNHELGGPEVLQLHLDLADGIRQVVQINLREHDRRLKRRIAAGTAR